MSIKQKVYKHDSFLISIMMLIVMMAFSCFNDSMSSSYRVEAASNTNENAYLSYRGILETKQDGVFGISDLNSDGIPELLYYKDTPNSINIYTYKNGKSIKLDTSNMGFLSAGDFMVSSDRKSFCFYRSTPETWGFTYNYVEYKVDGDSIVKKEIYKAKKKRSGTSYYRNDVKISYSSYTSFTTKFKNIKFYSNNANNREDVCNAGINYTWKSDSTGWWVEVSTGDCPKSKWRKIGGSWYYFKKTGYMAHNEWISGYWLDRDGRLTYSGRAGWQSNSIGWWYADTNGWYAVSSWQQIDGYWYYFNSSGYMVTNTYIDGWWIGADGVCY